MKSSPIIARFLKDYREVVPFVEDDVVMADYIRKTMEWLDNYEITYDE